jgi:hypothetical protein
MRPWILAVALVACGGGGGSKSYTVVQEANPNPFHASGCKLSVGDVTYDPSIAASDDDKKAFSFALKQEVVLARAGIVQDGPPGAGAFLMRPTLASFTPGAESSMQIDITDAGGAQVLEQIRVSAKPSSLRDASGFGHAIGKYVKSRFCSR